jgi:hypothetical protein
VGKKKEKDLVHWNGTIWKQGELSLQHSRRKTSHDRFGLDMKVAQHLIGAPATDEPYDVSVDFGAEEGHSSSCPQ